MFRILNFRCPNDLTFSDLITVLVAILNFSSYNIKYTFFFFSAHHLWLVLPLGDCPQLLPIQNILSASTKTLAPWSRCVNNNANCVILSQSHCTGACPNKNDLCMALWCVPGRRSRQLQCRQAFFLFE